jgi:uncharacterized coiled-coil protein SlyX
MAARKRNNTAGERIAALEATLAAQNAVNEKVIERLDALTTVVEEVRAQQQKQRGFIGGVIVAVSAVWAVVLAGLQFLGPK